MLKPAVNCHLQLRNVLFSRVNQLAHFPALRKTMVRAHIQAWAWQDEWVGLTMDDIRNIERETQELLKRTMGAAAPAEKEEEEEEEETPNPLKKSTSDVSKHQVRHLSLEKCFFGFGALF